MNKYASIVLPDGTVVTGPPGAPGESAYQAAVAGGYAGTEAEFQVALAEASGHAADKNNPHGVTAAAVGARKQVPAVTVTLSSSGWTSGQQTVAVSGLGATQDGIAQIAQTATTAQRTAERRALLAISGQAANQLTFHIDGETPSVDIPVTIILL